jgi:hypothetical protein
MNYKDFFINLISQFFSGKLSRKEIAHTVAMELPIDHVYDCDVELMKNCEWGLRHIDEDNYWTPENELRYYLSCLKGDEQFTVEARDRALNS